MKRSPIVGLTEIRLLVVPAVRMVYPMSVLTEIMDT